MPFCLFPSWAGGQWSLAVRYPPLLSHLALPLVGPSRLKTYIYSLRNTTLQTISTVFIQIQTEFSELQNIIAGHDGFSALYK